MSAEAANLVTLCLRERLAVPHDRCESVRLSAHSALRVAVVLVRDHDDEGEQQAEERRDDAEHLRRNLGVEPLGDRGHESSDQPDQHQDEADDRDDDCD